MICILNNIIGAIISSVKSICPHSKYVYECNMCPCNVCKYRCMHCSISGLYVCVMLKTGIGDGRIL